MRYQVGSAGGEMTFHHYVTPTNPNPLYRKDPTP